MTSNLNSDESKAIRFACLMSSSNLEASAEGYKQMIKLCEKLGWKMYCEELITSIKNDKNLYKILFNFLQEFSYNNLTKTSSSVETMDSYFLKLNPKDIQTESLKIKEYSKQYYDAGNFSAFISVFNRFLVLIKNDLPESELHIFLIKFVVSCIIKKQFDIGLSEISKLKQQYHNHDISIYLFLLKLVQGKFFLAEEEILNISQNIFPDVFEKLIDLDSIAFYFKILLLICHKKHVLASIQTTSHILAYKIIEDTPEIFTIIENYKKCRFSSICSEFDSIKKRIASDSILSIHSDKINSSLKENIIVLVLKSSSSIPFTSLSKIVREEVGVVRGLVVGLIENGLLNCKIDGINQIVITIESNSLNSTIKKSIENSQKSYQTAITKLIMNSITKPCNLTEGHLRSFKQVDVQIRGNKDVNRMGGMSGYGMDEMFQGGHMRMDIDEDEF